jgi:copper chaperone CopZ
MSCTACEAKIETKLKKHEGIINVSADSKKNVVNISYEGNKISPNTIISIIEKLHYSSKIITDNEENKFNTFNFVGILIILIAVYLIIQNTIGFNFSPEISENMGYGMLFVTGLITSLHCMAMCGGINLSSCISNNNSNLKDSSTIKNKTMPSFLYNLGRVISYTAIGGIVGAIGNVISFGGKATRNCCSCCRYFYDYFWN